MLILSFKSWIQYHIVPGEHAWMHQIWQWSIINCFLRTVFKPVIQPSHRNLILSTFPYHKWLIWRKEDLDGSRHAWRVCLATRVIVTCTWLLLKCKISHLLTNLRRKDIGGPWNCLTNILLFLPLLLRVKASNSCKWYALGDLVLWKSL